MPEIVWDLKARDEASTVIDKVQGKMNGLRGSYSSAVRSPGLQQFQQKPSQGRGGGSGGMSGILGSGKIGAGAGITIIAQAALQALQKIWKVLNEASPYLQAVSQQFKTAMNIYLRPMGDAIAKMLQPMSEREIERAEDRARLFEQMEQDWGPVAVILGTVGFALYDVKAALWEFNYGVWNALSKVYLWPMDKLGDLLGVDLPGSLTELLDQMFGIKGGFAGIQEFFEKGLPEKLGQMGENFKTNFMAGVDQIVSFFGTVGDALKSTLTNALSTIGSTLSGFGSWLWSGITSALSGAWSTISGFGTWIYKSLKNALGGIGNEAYKAFHNAIASMLNGIANIELPLVGKPFKGLFGTIPMLASGGIVTQPTLAMIGERGAEAVIPLNKAGQLGMGQGMNVTIQMNAPVYGVDDLERTIRDMMSREQLGYTGYR